MRAGVLLAGVALAGCFDFRKDLEACQQERRCPLPDGGYFVRSEGLCAQGVCWENPYPTGVPLSAVHAAGPNEFYAGGAGGVVVHIRGAEAEIAYLARPIPPSVDWRPVTALATCSTGPSAMSQDRKLFRLTDAGFVSVPLSVASGSRPTVADGWTSPEGTCTFLGNDFQAAWVGEERAGNLVSLGSPPDTPTYYRTMTGLGGTSAQDLWLASERDVFARAEDGGFDVDTVPLPDGGLGRVTGVCSLGGGEVFLSTTVGLRARAQGWGALGGTEPLSGVACLAQGKVLAIGAKRIRQCAVGGGCTDLESSETWTRATAAGDRALVGSNRGDLALVSEAGDLLRLSSGVRTDLLNLAVAGSDDTWASGKDATLLRRTDAGWAWVDAGFSATDALYALAVLSDGRVAVAGTNGAMRVLHPDGRVDKPKFYDVGGQLVQNQALGRDIYGIREAAGAVWAVGGRGLLMREAADGTWQLQAGTEPLGIYDLRANEAGVTWYTGEGALIYQSQPDGTFQSIRGPFGSYSLYTIFPASNGDVWFGGRDGLVLRRLPDGRLEQHRFPNIPTGPDDIRGFVEQPGDAVYAVGELSLYRYTGVGTNWEILGPLPLDPVANAIRAVGARGDDFWVAGGGGAILRVNRALWLRSP